MIDEGLIGHFNQKLSFDINVVNTEMMEIYACSDNSRVPIIHATPGQMSWDVLPFSLRKYFIVPIYIIKRSGF